MFNRENFKIQITLLVEAISQRFQNNNAFDHIRQWRMNLFHSTMTTI